jgi:hypothetical protein
VAKAKMMNLRSIHSLIPCAISLNLAISNAGGLLRCDLLYPNMGITEFMPEWQRVNQ